MTSFAVGLRPTIVAAGDFDGDGAYDLVGAANSTAILTNALTGRPRRCDGNGDGRLSAPDLALLGRALTTQLQWRVEDLQQRAMATSGIDANGDGLVDASDLRLPRRLLFGPTGPG